MPNKVLNLYLFDIIFDDYINVLGSEHLPKYTKMLVGTNCCLGWLNACSYLIISSTTPNIWRKDYYRSTFKSCFFLYYQCY